MGVEPKIGVPQNGWFIMENHIKMDDLGVPLFLETPKWINIFSENFGQTAERSLVSRVFFKGHSVLLDS